MRRNDAVRSKRVKIFILLQHNKQATEENERKTRGVSLMSKESEGKKSK